VKHHEPSLAKWALCYAVDMSIHSIEQAAAEQPFSVAQPAAGQNWTFTVPANTVYKLDTFSFTLVTSATVATRFITLEFTDASGNIIFAATNGTGQAASLTARTTASRFINYLAVAGSNASGSQFPLPDVWLPAGYIVKVVTTNLDAADQFSAVTGLAQVAEGSF